MKTIKFLFPVAVITMGLLASCTNDEASLNPTNTDATVAEVNDASLLTSFSSIYKTSDPSWTTLIGNTKAATTAAQQAALVKLVADEKLDTRGTQINVVNSTYETTATGSRAVLADSNLRFHNPLDQAATSPTGNTRWYQKDGNTQVFRVFPGDQNMQSSRGGAARSETYAPKLGVRKSDNKIMTFSARYFIAQNNGSKDVKIFQSKATAEDGFDPAWGCAVHCTAAGSIDVLQRNAAPNGRTIRIVTGKKAGESFNLRVTDDGETYKAFIDDKEVATAKYDRKNLKSVCRWGAYVQGGDTGVLTGTKPQIVYVSGARVTLTDKK